MAVLVQIVGNVGRNPELVSFETGALQQSSQPPSMTTTTAKIKKASPLRRGYAAESWNGSTELVLEILITQGRKVMAVREIDAARALLQSQQRYVTKPLVKMADFHRRSPKPEEKGGASKQGINAQVALVD